MRLLPLHVPARRLNGNFATLPQVTGGKLKAIGVSSPARDPSLPNVPTIAEPGVKGCESEGNAK